MKSYDNYIFVFNIFYNFWQEINKNMERFSLKDIKNCIIFSFLEQKLKQKIAIWLSLHVLFFAKL